MMNVVGPSKRLSFDGTLLHKIKSTLCHSDGSHAVMDSSWSKSSLRDFESSAFSQQHVRNWNSNVFKEDLIDIIIVIID